MGEATASEAPGSRVDTEVDEHDDDGHGGQGGITGDEGEEDVLNERRAKVDELKGRVAIVVQCLQRHHKLTTPPEEGFVLLRLQVLPIRVALEGRTEADVRPNVVRFTRLKEGRGEGKANRRVTKGVRHENLEGNLRRRRELTLTVRVEGAIVARLRGVKVAGDVERHGTWVVVRVDDKGRAVRQDNRRLSLLLVKGQVVGVELGRVQLLAVGGPVLILREELSRLSDSADRLFTQQVVVSLCLEDEEEDGPLLRLRQHDTVRLLGSRVLLVRECNGIVPLGSHVVQHGLASTQLQVDQTEPEQRHHHQQNGDQNTRSNSTGVAHRTGDDGTRLGGGRVGGPVERRPPLVAKRVTSTTGSLRSIRRLHTSKRTFLLRLTLNVGVVRRGRGGGSGRPGIAELHLRRDRQLLVHLNIVNNHTVLSHSIESQKSE